MTVVSPYRFFLGSMLLCAGLGSVAAPQPVLAEGLRFAFEPASRFGAPGQSHVLSMRGEIDVGDAERFLHFVLQHRERFIADGGRLALVIDGGDVVEALRLGELLRDALVQAWLPDASRTRCVSACFFLFAYCVSRQAAPESIGLHRFYFEGRALAASTPEAVRRRYESLEKELRTRMLELAVPISLIETWQRLPAGEVYRLTQADLSRLGASQPWFDDYLAARCETEDDEAVGQAASCREEVLRDHRRQFVEQAGTADD